MLLQEKHGKTKDKGDEDVKEIDEKLLDLRKPDKLQDLIGKAKTEDEDVNGMRSICSYDFDLSV